MRQRLSRIVGSGLLVLACSAGGARSDGVVGPSASGGSSAGGSAVSTPRGGSANAGTSAGAGTGGTTGGQTSPAAGGGAPAQGASGSGGTPGSSGGTTPATGGAAAGGAPPVGGGSSAGGTAGAGGLDAGGSSTGGSMGGIGASLKEKYASYFPIGAAVDSQSYTTHDSLLVQHFNSVTAENEMKFESLQPTEGNFTYAAADRIVDYATRNDMKVRGHALVWHTQTPAWVFSNGAGGTVSAEALLMRMKNHIDNVGRHFRGKVYAWDVVNEAIMLDGSFRAGDEPEGQQSPWFEIIGERYIAEAFRYAHAADPDAKLYYNDFHDHVPAKRQAIYEMLQRLLADGVPVHGVGMQCHLSIEPSTDPASQGYHQSVENLEAAIELYSSLGLDVQVTEMDVSLYVPGVMYTQDTFYTAAKFTDELKAQQAARYRAFFDLFRKHADVITGVTLWGIADDNTWLSEFSSGRKDFPLLFDDDHRPKPAYDAVAGF